MTLLFDDRRQPDITRVLRSSRHGAMVVLIVILLPMFLFLVALAVDVGYMQLVRTELRAACDAATRAAGESLSREQNLSAAREAAKSLAAANLVAGKPLQLADSDIVFGRSTLQPDGSWLFAPNGQPINSVRVNARRTNDSPSGSVGLFFGRAMGIGQFQPVQLASAVRLDRDICVVVDRSSSMKLALNSTTENMSASNPRFCQPPWNDSRWSALDSAMDVFIDALEETQYIEFVALVSYASAGTWCSVANTDADIDQTLTESTVQIAAAMNRLSNRVFNGNTNISAGMDNARTVLTGSRSRPFAAKTMVLMTDGLWNRGRDPILAANDAAQQGIVIHTITFGTAANQASMRAVATRTGGRHYHAPDAAALREAFRQIALALPVVLTQ